MRGTSYAGYTMTGTSTAATLNIIMAPGLSLIIVVGIATLILFIAAFMFPVASPRWTFFPGFSDPPSSFIALIQRSSVSWYRFPVRGESVASVYTFEYSVCDAAFQHCLHLSENFSKCSYYAIGKDQCLELSFESYACFMWWGASHTNSQ